MKDEKWKTNPTNSRLIIWILRSIGFILVISLLIPLISSIDKAYITYLGPFGDAINGITAPFIGLVVAILTFMAFIVQFEANQKQIEVNENQRKDIQIERFENKFYEMIRLHRENVNEIELGGVYKGREVFDRMYEEFKFIYKYLKYLSKKRSYYDERWCLVTSYYYFFKGVSEDSKPLNSIQIQLEVEGELISFLNKHQEEYKIYRRVIQKKNKTIYNYPYIIKEYSDDLEIDFKYQPFKGYSSIIGHYFRHLYQSLKLAATDPILSDIDDEKEFKKRYQYIKLIRVQLSNSEQSMIYFNSFFSSGKVWWEDKDFLNPWNEKLSYFLDYAIIKNIPLHQIREDKLGPDPEKEFSFRILERNDLGQKTYFSISQLFEQLGG